MTIQELYQAITNQVQSSGTLALNSVILTDTDVTLIQQNFGLTSGQYLEIGGLATSDIPEPSNSEISFQKGSLSIFNQQALTVNVRFKVESGNPQLTLQIELPQNWKLTDSFPNLTVFPFSIISLNSSTLIYSSVAISEFTPAFNTYPEQVSLGTGLNLVSMLPLTEISVLSNLFSGSKLPGTSLLFGSFSARQGLPYPVCELKALLLDSSTTILPDISLSNLYLTVQVTDPGTSYIQNFIFGIETQSSTFDYFISLGYDNGSVNFAVIPNAGTPTTLESLAQSDIVKSILPENTDFSKWIPSELNTAFESIAFLGASFGFDIQGRKVKFVRIKIGQVPNVGPITLGPLSFSKLALSATWINYGQGLIPAFNFSGETDVKLKAFSVPINFMISVDKSESGYELGIIDASVQSAVPLSQLISDVDSSVAIPEILKDFYLGDFYFRYDHSNKLYTASFVGAYSPEVFNSLFSANIAIGLTKSVDGWESQLGGGFAIGNESWVNIDIELQKSGGSKEFIFSGSSNLVLLGSLIYELVSELGISDYSFINFNLTNFSIDYNKKALNEASVSAQCEIGETQETFNLTGKKNTTTNKWEFYADIDVSAGSPIDLGSMIPVVGSDLKGFVMFNDIGLYITSKDISEFAGEQPNLIPGLSMSLSGALDGVNINVQIPLYIYKSPPTSSSKNLLKAGGGTIGIPTPPSQSVKWINFSKTIGPVTFNKFGFLPSGNEVSIYPDVILSKGGLELSLEGVSINVSVKELLQKKLDASFSINGLGVSYQNNILEVTGQFLKTEIEQEENFLGEVIARFSRFGLTAIGGYSPASPESFFIYANLNGTLGGPPALYITGIAFGFGLNYELIPPTLETLGTYPLLPQYAPESPVSPSDAMTALTALETGNVVQNKPGENWIAAGLQVTSFNMITGFALVTVSYGLETNIGILGSCSMTLPKGDTTPLGYVSINVTANFNPASGLLPILGAVSPQTYFLSKAITLNGGFAFYVWYSGEHSGDFVFTIGGYYPGFDIPNNYPQVAPVDINFSLGPFHAEGNAYLALTPGAFMAGFRFTASWSFANITAWYSEGLDFLVEWAPFSYRADAYINVGCSVELALFTVNVSIGADAVVWGPDFGGRAHIDLDIVSFTIHFGSSQTTPPPVSWNEMEQKFLPSGLKGTPPSAGDEALLMQTYATGSSGENVSTSASVGLLKTKVVAEGQTYDWLMDPNHFEMNTSTKIPANKAQWAIAYNKQKNTTTYSEINNVAAGNDSSFPNVNPFPNGATWNPVVNIRPMKLSKVLSTHSIILLRADNDNKFTEYITEVSITPVFTNSNAALWGDPNDSGKANVQLLSNTLEGFIITPIPRHPAEVNQIPLIELIFEEGNDIAVHYTQKTPDTSYTVSILTDTDQALDIEVKGESNPPQSDLTNVNLILNSLTNLWVEDQRNSILQDLNMNFGTLSPGSVSLAIMATSEQLNDWPQVQILGS